MRNLILVLVPLLVLLVGLPASAADVTYEFEFDYDAVHPACATASSNGCVAGFEIHRKNNDGSRTLIGILSNAATPSGLVTLSATFPVGAPFGQQTFFAITVARDGSGARSESIPSNEITVNIPPRPPKALRLR